MSLSRTDCALARGTDLDQIKGKDRATVSFKQIVKVQSSGTVKRVHEIHLQISTFTSADEDSLWLTVYVRLWRHARIVLGPVEWNATTVLHERGIIWAGKEPCARGMEGCCQHLRHNLLSLDVIGDIALGNDISNVRPMNNASYKIVGTSFKKPGAGKVSRTSGY